MSRALVVVLILATACGGEDTDAIQHAQPDAGTSYCLELCRPCRDVGDGVEAVQACARDCYGWADAGTPPPLDTVCQH